MRTFSVRPANRQAYITIISLLIFALLAFWFGTGCGETPVTEPTPGSVSRVDFPSSTDGFKVPCSIYLPTGYNASVATPAWVDLHALYGKPVLDNDPNNSFSNDMKKLADQNGYMLVEPWGRNLHSLYLDGVKKSSEPNVFDDFSGGAGSWRPGTSSWAASGGVYRQSNTAATWKESVRSNTTGKDYSVRVRVRDLAATGVESAVGINIRRSSTGGNNYHLDLYKDAAGTKYVRFWQWTGGTGQEIYRVQFPWEPVNPADGWIDLKFSSYHDYLEVYVNEEIINMQPGTENIPYGYGRKVTGTPLAAGEVSLCSYGGVNEFTNFRVQNEYEYGEQDVIDCILGAMEKFRIDPTKVFLAGHSQGGLGTFSVGLHHPDLFAAMRPADGFTDLIYDYQWLKTYYPPNPGAPYADVNDGQVCDYVRTIVGGEPDAAYPDRQSILNGSSARYILENALNSSFRIVQGTPDAIVPNSRDPVPITWWGPWFITWGQIPAPAKYTPATSTYANGKDMADLLASWSVNGGYSSTYVTDPNVGHGFIEPYADTAAYFMTKTLNRKPAEVAYKTYDNKNTGAWWLKLQIAQPGQNKPGMARAKANPSANSAALHARNLSRLSLDVRRMGLDNGAGKTLSFSADDNTAPNVFSIADSTGSFALELLAPWATTTGYTVTLDGMQTSNFTVSGSSLVINQVPTTNRSHAVTVKVPSTLPANLASNPGAESADSNGSPLNWTGVTSSGGTASFLWDDLEPHLGGRSLRIKNPAASSASSAAMWKSSNIPVSAGSTYLLSAFAKQRMFRGSFLGLGIAWYGSNGTQLRTDWSNTLTGSGSATNSDWSPTTLSKAAPTGASYACIVAGTTGTTPSGVTGSAWFDDFSFTKQ
jgi:pimeloyl-ACP methyl ester carboxylesterase